MKKVFLVCSLIFAFLSQATLIYAEQEVHDNNCFPDKGCIQDSFFRSKIINVRKSGNKYIIIQMEFENLTDQKEKIVFQRALLVDTNGNASIVSSNMPSMIVPEKGKRSIGLTFEFEKIEQLTEKFHLTIESSSPPGTISFVDLGVTEK